MCVRFMDNYYLRFPSVLRNELNEKKIDFPDNLEMEYNQFLAFRGIRFIKNRKESLIREDFMSQIELKLQGNPFYSQTSEEDIDNYGVSLFCTKDELLTGFRLPRKNKAIAQGVVTSDLGAISINKQNSHVLWFLYDNVHPEENFKVIEYYEKVDGSQEYRAIEL